MQMKSSWAVVLAGLMVAGTCERLVGQTRGSGGPSSNRPSTGAPRSSSPPGSRVGRSRPSPPSGDQRFRSAMALAPSPFPGRRAHPPVRSLWFGLIALDRSWLWTPGAADEMVAAPRSTPPAPEPFGGLQLDFAPPRALVSVDGWYLGPVDEFSGYYRH